jgi:hypothetical protein
MASDLNVDSAKVSRSAAVWVAGITAIGGFATAVATGSLGLLQKPAPVIQRWLQIGSVQLASNPHLPQIDRVHLIAQVNGVSYSYPTSPASLWAPVGPGMASERFPLPVLTEGYRVKFFAFGATLDGKFPRYEHKGFAEFESRQIPLKSATQTLQLSESGPNGLPIAMTVRFSIE